MGKDELDLIDAVSLELLVLLVIFDYLSELTIQASQNEDKKITMTFTQMDKITTTIYTTIMNIKKILKIGGTK